MAVIKVPKTPRQAFNKNRRASELLLSQIRHLEWAALPASQRKPHQLPKGAVKTEGQAADRIRQLTKMILAAKATAAAAPPSGAVVGRVPVVLPPVPNPPKPRARKTTPRRPRGRRAAVAASKAAATQAGRASRPRARSKS